MSARDCRERWLRDVTAAVVALLAAAAVLLSTQAHAQGAPPEGSGSGGISASAPSEFPDGSESAPSITNIGDTNTGIYFPGADEVGINTGGTRRFYLTVSSLTLTLPLRLPAGSVTDPSVAWADDADGTGSGWYRQAANVWSLALNGAEAFRFSSSELRMISPSTFWARTMRDSVGNQRLDFGASSTNTYTSQAGASGVAHSFESQTTNTSGTLARFCAGNGTGCVSAVDFAGKGSFNGGVDINTTSAKPTCNSSARGTIWVTEGGAGVADIIEKCLKDAADAYAWSAL